MIFKRHTRLERTSWKIPYMSWTTILSESFSRHLCRFQDTSVFQDTYQRFQDVHSRDIIYFQDTIDSIKTHCDFQETYVSWEGVLKNILCVLNNRLEQVIFNTSLSFSRHLCFSRHLSTFSRRTLKRHQLFSRDYRCNQDTWWFFKRLGVLKRCLEK